MTKQPETTETRDPPQRPKCGKLSGDDWKQCGGECPMPGSPHYTRSKDGAL